MFEIGGKQLDSRLFIGTGKYSDNSMFEKVAHASGSQVVTVALRRLDRGNLRENMMDHIPKDMILLPNTSGARTAQEAVRIARLAKAMGMGDWIKIEVINDSRYLMPDSLETLRAVEILAKEGFKVFPYMSPDLSMGARMRDAGACAVMPLGSPIGSNRGIRTTELIRIMIEELKCPIIVDAGIGRPSQAAAAMEMGAAAVLVNTAIASSSDPVAMAGAFKIAVEAGRAAYLAGLGASNGISAEASSPLTGFLGEI